MPILPAIPTRDPVYFGPRSAWFTPNPPWHIPEHVFTKHNRTKILIKVSWNGIKIRKIEEPKNPIVFTVFLTVITLDPLFINESANIPPNKRASTETRLGIRIKYIKILESNSIPKPPVDNGSFTYLGKYDKKVYRAQLLQNVAIAIARNGWFLISFDKGIFGGVSLEGASLII